MYLGKDIDHMKLQLLWHWLEWELWKDLGDWSYVYWQIYFFILHLDNQQD